MVPIRATNLLLTTVVMAVTINNKNNGSKSMQQQIDGISCGIYDYRNLMIFCKEFIHFNVPL